MAGLAESIGSWVYDISPAGCLFGKLEISISSTSSRDYEITLPRVIHLTDGNDCTKLTVSLTVSKKMQKET